MLFSLEKNGKNIRRVCEAAKSCHRTSSRQQANKERPQRRGNQQQDITEPWEPGDKELGPQELHSESARE